MILKYALPVIFSLTLAACTQSSDSGENTDTATQGDGEAQQVRETETILYDQGYDPVRIGATREDVIAELGAASDPDADSGPDPEACEEFHPERAPEGMYVMFENGRLSRITLAQGSTVQTDRAIGVGSTAADVREAYGDSIIASPHNYVEAPGEYLTAWGGGLRPGSYVQDESARGIRYEIGTDGRVESIHAGGPSIQYVEGCL